MTSLKILLLNARSVRGKLNEIQVLSAEYDIICITETHLDPSFHNEMILGSSQKTIYRSDRDCHGGGVLLALATCLPQEQVILKESYFPVEVVCVKVGRPKDDNEFFIFCLYIPPKHTREAVAPLDDLLSFMISNFPGSNLLVVGDFNFPDIDWCNLQVRSGSSQKYLHRNFLNCILSNDLDQIITEPTHQLGNTLDLVMTNQSDFIFDYRVINPGISDHFMIEFCVAADFKTSHEQTSFIKLYNKADFTAISDLLVDALSDIENAIDNKADINSVWQIFETTINLAVLKYVPKCIPKKRDCKEPMWFNNTARRAVKQQRKLYDKSKRTGLKEDHAKYKQTRRNNKKSFRKMEQDYYNRVLFEPLERGDSKPFYSFYKRKSGNNSQSTATFKNKSAFQSSEIFNEYFQGVFSKDDSSPVPQAKLPADKCPIQISNDGVLKLLKGLKRGKAPGPDNLRKEDLCLDPVVTSKILASIFQYSLDIGKLPDIWKVANVVPVHKKGSREDPGNFRPISLTCISCKLLEHIVLSNINSDLDKILNPNQHGFRRGLSCTTQLVTTVNEIMKLVDDNNIVHAAVLDFSKAFDKVSHRLLIDKLIKSNIEPYMVSWIGAFLSNRLQRVVIEGTASCDLLVSSGVPQGSVLGPTLFLVYINDISDNLKFSSVKLFADDALIFSPVNTSQDSLNFQEDLALLDQWTTNWKMSFNIDKCQIVIFSRQNHIDPNVMYHLNGQSLTLVNSFKYLGVFITNNFSWDLHIDSIISKASQRLGMVRHVLFNAPRKVKRVAYLTLCRPILEYASEVWDPHLSRQITSLEAVQRKAIRFISGIRGRQSVTKAGIFLDIQLLELRRKHARMSLMLKCLSGNSHASLIEDFNQLQNNIHDHETRLVTGGAPLAVCANTGFYTHSFLPKTSRNLRGLV